jgi:hypothetical protein
MQATETTRNQLDLSYWFDNMIATLRADQIELESGIANKEKQELYRPLLSGDAFKMAENVRTESSKFFISEIVRDYFNELKIRKANPVSLALQLSESKILVWAIVHDDDEACEDQLFLAEAAVNSRFHQHGFYVSTTLVEESDSCKVPNHFALII